MLKPVSTHTRVEALPMLRIQTSLRKGVAEKFEEYRKRNNNMSVYRASAYLVELGLKVLEERRNSFERVEGEKAVKDSDSNFSVKQA